MARNNQPDMFSEDTQSDLFGAESVPSYRPDPEKVRSAAAQDFGGGAGGTDIPMGTDASVALPDHLSADVALAARRRSAQLRFEFETEIKRLEAA